MTEEAEHTAIDPARLVPFPRTTVGVVIKALNEQNNISRAIESALECCAGRSATVVLADSGSSDRTLEIASNYDIRIVKLINSNEKSCGIGAQLGFQHLDCDFVYILDGDMEIFPDFIPAAITVLEQDHRIVAVGGIVEEHGAGNYEFEHRRAARDGVITGVVDSLDMGGLYRVSAIREIGYLTNRNLHSYEEKELGLRLRAAGGLLMRLQIPSVRHFGKTESTMDLIASRWKSRHLDGPGELLRSSLGRPYQKATFLMVWNLIAVLVSWLWLLAAPLTARQVRPWLIMIPLIFHVSLYANFVRKTKSLPRATIAYLNLMILSASFLRGLLRPQVDPAEPVASEVIR